MPWLDWVRFVAAFVVMFGHTRGFSFVAYEQMEPSYKSISMQIFVLVGRMSHEAVIAFFVISGFLVGGGVINKSWQGTFDPSSYSVDRIIRIGTPLLPALALTAIAGYIMTGEVNWAGLLGNIVALQGIVVEPLWPNEPLWSLSYEIWFYVLAGGLGALVVRPSLGAALVTMFGIIAFFFLKPVYLLIWVIGSVMYFYQPKRLIAETLGASIIATSGLVLSQLTRSSQTLEALPISNDVSLLLLAAGVAWLLPCLKMIRCPQRLASAGSFMAAPSYTLYLTHVPILHLAAYFGVERQQPDLTGWITFLSLLAICTFASFISYLAFESRTVQVKVLVRRIFSIRPPAPTGAI